MEHKEPGARFPCKGCTERRGGCHAVCEQYKAAKAEYETLKAERDKKRRVTRVLNDYASDMVSRNRKRSGRKWNGKEGGKRY